MKFVLKISILLFVSFSLRAQADFKDTTWYTNDWKETVKSNSSFYRVYGATGTGFIVYDKYLNGQNQMVAEASVINPEVIKQGAVVYYSANGVRERRGSYDHNRRMGDWVTYFNEGNDSSITVYKNDGSSVVIRRSSEEEIYTIVEVQAEFPGGFHELSKFIQLNLKYPDNARALLLGGKAFLKFVVNEEGSINDVEILKSTGNKEMDNEAIRVVNLMPKWEPAKQTGRAVKCYFNLPISYSLVEPFYTYNVYNKNEQYLKISNLIFKGKADEAYFLVKEVDDNQSDIDLLYNKAVLYFVYTDRIKSCEIFKKITQIADQGGSIYKNSIKYYNQYCN